MRAVRVNDQITEVKQPRPMIILKWVTFFSCFGLVWDLKNPIGYFGWTAKKEFNTQVSSEW